MDEGLLLACFEEVAKDYVLRPAYAYEEMKWLWAFLKGNQARGELRGRVVYDNRERKVGAYLYYLRPKSTAEVMVLLARKRCYDLVFENLIYSAWKAGATCVTGRMEPRFMQCFWDHNCLFKRGSWALVHAQEPELINIINRGDALLTNLEGELWLRSPRDRL